MKVKEIMTTELVTLRKTHTLDLVEDIMSWQCIRHVPIVDEHDRLVGLVTHRDLLRASISSLAKMSEKDQREIYRTVPVTEIMRTKVSTVTPDTDLRDAAAMMIDEKLGCLPVLDGRRLVGIITEADFLTLAWEAMGLEGFPKKNGAVKKYPKATASEAAR